jgi:hypothetical protein
MCVQSRVFNTLGAGINKIVAMQCSRQLPITLILCDLASVASNVKLSRVHLASVVAQF